MGNAFGTDIIIQWPDPKQAARFYVEQLDFTIDMEQPHMIGLHGKHISLFIEKGPALGPVLDVSVGDVEVAKNRLAEKGCQVIKDEPNVPRCYVRDPFGLIYNLSTAAVVRSG